VTPAPRHSSTSESRVSLCCCWSSLSFLSLDSHSSSSSSTDDSPTHDPLIMASTVRISTAQRYTLASCICCRRICLYVRHKSVVHLSVINVGLLKQRRNGRSCPYDVWRGYHISEQKLSGYSVLFASWPQQQKTGRFTRVPKFIVIVNVNVNHLLIISIN